ncbi:oligosaccharide flippase family protein [Lactiplantibacillus plantarum]|nr:oligosaccharide flippase family protein [Lactiplantibacillus plantarum]
MYPYLNDYKDERVDGNTLSYFKKNIVGMLSSKVGGIVVNGTDNILLSYFIGLDAVGLYSNYTLILNGLTNVLNQAVTSVASSVGNLAASRGSQEKQKRVFYNYYALSTLLVLFATVGFTAFSSTFIRYWIGSRYIYTQLPLFLISLNFYFQGIRQPVITYTNAYGLYWYARYKSIFESVVNLVVSIVLIKFTGLGISAVLLGTITSNMLVNLWWEPLIVFKWGLKKVI